MEKFGIDSYLYNLSKDIKNNKTMQYIKFDNKFNITIKSLKEELSLYRSIGLNLQDVFVKYRGKTCYTSPKNIKLIIGKECNGIDISHLCRYIYKYNLNPKVFDAINQYIFINTFCNYSAKSSYLHEIAHTQLVITKNLENSDNEEIIPMFIEFIYGYINNTSQLLYKAKRLSSYVDGYMYTTCEKTRNDTRRYITSTLKAIKLYNLYMNNLGIGSEIIYDLSKVFKYEATLEEILDKYEISLENSKPSLEKILKLGKGEFY